jgi:hypothetical protein
MAAFCGVEDPSLESGDLLVSEVIRPRRDREAIYERGLVEGRAWTGRISCVLKAVPGCMRLGICRRGRG